MPGLNLYIGTADPRAGILGAFRTAQQKLLHNAGYSAQVRFAESGCVVGDVGYREYPMLVVQQPSFILLEGRIYNRPTAQLPADLKSLAADVFATPDSQRVVRDWICNHDGEYVVLLVSPTGTRALLFSDPLGRLPLYYFSDTSRLVVSRECKFVAEMSGRREFDKVGVAEYLWTGHPLGNRTLLENVSRAPGAVLLRVSYGKAVETRITSLVNFNFDEKHASAANVARYASELTDRIAAVSAARGKHDATSINVIALSGGLDSRTVAAAYKSPGVPCVAATYVAHTGRGATDAPLAAAIAAALNLEWHLFTLPPNADADERRLVWMKDGLNYAVMGFILPFLDRVAAKWGQRAVYTTGDGGHNVLPDLRPPRPISSLDELQAYLCRRRGLMAVEVAEAIAGLRRGTLRDAIRNVLESYPEKNLGNRAVHFVYDRARKWLFEGEDRNRYFLWETSPFFTYDVFDYAARIPDHLKAHNCLFTQVERRLSPAVARIPDATLGLAPSSPLFTRKAWLIDKYIGLPGGVRRLINKMRSRRFAVPESALMSAVSGSFMSAEAVLAMLKTADYEQYMTWRTLSLFEQLWTSPEAIPAQSRVA